MWVEVIKPYVEYLGARGVQRDIPANEAEIHILLGNCIAVKELKAESIEAPKKRRYKRRDLRAQE